MNVYSESALISRNLLKTGAISEIQSVYNETRTYNHLIRKRKPNRLAKVFVYDLGTRWYSKIYQNLRFIKSRIYRFVEKYVTLSYVYYETF